MILVYSGIAVLFFGSAILLWTGCNGLSELRCEIESIKHRLNSIELSFSGARADAAGARYKPMLTVQQQIAEELHFFIEEERLHWKSIGLEEQSVRRFSIWLCGAVLVLAALYFARHPVNITWFGIR